MDRTDLSRRQRRPTWRRLLPLGAMIVCLATMAGCATPRSVAPQPEPGPAPAPSDPGPEASAGQGAGLRLARSFAGPDTVLEPLPTAMLLLVERAPNNRAACEAFLEIPQAERLRAALAIDTNLIVTRMLLDTSTPDPTRLEDCEYLLARYNYALAREWIERLALDASQGPFFVVMFPVPPGDRSAAFLTLDASTLKSHELRDFTARWNESLATAASRMSATRAALDAELPEETPGLCNSMGDVVRTTTPVLLGMAGAALSAQYPGVVLIVGTYTQHDRGGAAQRSLRRLLKDVSDGLGTVTAERCSAIFGWLRTKLTASP